MIVLFVYQNYEEMLMWKVTQLSNLEKKMNVDKLTRQRNEQFDVWTIIGTYEY